MDTLVDTREIFISTDYDKFIPMQGQDSSRTTRNGAKLASAIASSKGNFIPIIVTDNYLVVDGNSRLEACKRCGVPVKYEILGNNIDALETMKMINTSGSVWNPDNFITFYAEGYKNEAYIDLIKFKRDNMLTLKEIIASTELIDHISIKNGEIAILPINEKKLLIKAKSITEEIFKLRPLPNPAYVMGAVAEIINFCRGFNKSQLLEAIKNDAYHNAIIQRLGAVSSLKVPYYVTYFNEIYNYNRKSNGAVLIDRDKFTTLYR